MAKIHFKMLPDKEGRRSILVRCGACGDVMRLQKVDKHAMQVHNATGVNVNTNTKPNNNSRYFNPIKKENTVAEKNVPVFLEKNGEKVQVGWATPANEGVRSLKLLDEYKNVSLSDIQFGDVEKFVTDLNPEDTVEEPRTFEESLEPVEDLEGNVIDEGGVVDDSDREEVPVSTQPVEVVPEPEEAAEPVEVAAEEADEDEVPVENTEDEESQEDDE